LAGVADRDGARRTSVNGLKNQMTENSDPAAAPPQGAGMPDTGLWLLLLMMARTFLASAQRDVLLILGGATFVVVGATAYAQIQMNAWNKPFYDALARKDLNAFFGQFLVFLTIAGALLVLNVAQTWLNQMIKLKLREGLVRDLVKQWLIPKRAFLLAGEGEIGVNPDQRIHEDARHLTELSTDLGIGLLQASLLLASFIGVLWRLPDSVTFTFNGSPVAIPGYMVWCALIYAAIGSSLSWLVGNPLIRLNAERYAREAGFRFALVRVNEHADSMALYGAEVDEQRRLGDEIGKVLDAMRRLVGGLTRLTWITAGYGWLAIIAPILVASPGYFGGNLTLGGLMVAAGAFTQVQQSLRWFVDNFNTIADWLATLRRVASFRVALVQMENHLSKSGQISRRNSADAKITFDDVSIVSSQGSQSLLETHVEIVPGERVLVTGGVNGGLTNLFRAVAGLWVWGAGRIGVPKAEGLMFLPRRPYLPPGTLRETVSYPSPTKSFTDADVVAAFESVGLSHLSAELDRTADWDGELTSDEAQRLAFARLRLHKPRWLCVDHALDSLKDEDREPLINMLDAELAGATIVSFGDADLREGFSSRTLHLAVTPRSRLESDARARSGPAG
jgi:putative ATP-binding cassette transporter